MLQYEESPYNVVQMFATPYQMVFQHLNQMVSLHSFLKTLVIGIIIIFDIIAKDQDQIHWLALKRNTRMLI